MVVIPQPRRDPSSTGDRHPPVTVAPRAPPRGATTTPVTDTAEPTYSADRRRATSANVTAAATDAFSDSTCDSIGIDTFMSHVSPTSRDRPRPSEPTTTTSGPAAASRS